LQFRPFYIVGQVDRPGEYPYRPGLTILKALSIAGGLQRMSDPGSLRSTREAITARGDLHVLGIQTDSLLIRKARLQAELKRETAIELPGELAERKNEAAVKLLLYQEQLIFDARKEAFVTQMSALNQLKEHLEKEVLSLNAQLETEDTQIRLVKKELQSVSSLVEKGLAVTPRQLQLERSLAQIEGDKLRVGTSLLRARQDISRTDIAILELQNKRTNEVTLDLREVETKLKELDRKSDMTEQLLYEAEVLAPQILARRARLRRARPVYTIVRQSGGQTTEANATETTEVRPGDTIKVEVPILLDPEPSVDVSTTPALPTRSASAPRVPPELK
jgi:polysaccharide export outer membrane protein/exopolysaccharide production protein ExoF